MTCYTRASVLPSFVSALALIFSANVHADVDAAAAKSLARKSDCFKCHAVDKDKDGPAYHKVAEKYRGKAEAEAKLIHHVTAGEKVKFPDGHEDDPYRIPVNGRDGERDPLPFFIDPEYNELPGLRVVGDMGCTHPHLVDFISQLITFLYAEQPGHS